MVYLQMGNILTELRMEACCRKIHVLNGASDDRRGVPVQKRHFLISIPKQFALRMDLRRGGKIHFIIDKTKRGRAYVLTAKAMSSLDSFVKDNCQKFWDEDKCEPIERNLQCKTVDPKQFSFCVGWECMNKLGWPTTRGTRVHMVIIDEMILKLELMKEVVIPEHL